MLEFESIAKNRIIIFLKFTNLFLAFLLVSLTIYADQYEFLGAYQSHQVNENSVLIQGENNVMKLTIISEAIIRIQVGKENKILDIPSYAVNPSLVQEADWTLKEEKLKLLLTLPYGQVVIHKNPIRLQFLDDLGSEIEADDPGFGHGWDGKEVRVWKKLHPDVRFFGLGEKTGPLDKQGSHWVNWNTDFWAYEDRQDPLYVSIPFLIGLHEGRAYGIFFDNSYRSTYNLGAGNNRLYSFGAEDGEMNYYFIFGPEIRDVISRYTLLTGRMPLLPKWSLGYQQCRWSYYPEYEVMDLAKNFRQRQIPADVIYLDFHHMDEFKVFTWNKERFPDPERMLAELKKMGFKVIPIIDPGIKIEAGYAVHDEGVAGDHFITFQDGQLYKGAVWPGWCYFPDFSKASTREWWGKWYGQMKDQGVSGFWNDMNEPAVWGRELPYPVLFDDEGQKSTIKKMHNVYAHLEAQATYEGLRKHSLNERPFILTRSGWAGTQKYAAKWTGDNIANFKHLRMSVQMCLGLGLSGVPFVGPDIGGFVGSPTPELFARWVQLGVFMPFFRNHTSRGTEDQEPWTFGEHIEEIARGYISLRYQLMPYIYSAFRDCAINGVPMMRPLFLDYQDDEKTYSSEYQYQFLFGENILVAPVVEENRPYKKVYLPEGQWLDKWTEKVHQGKTEVIVDAPLGVLPAFFRVGGFVPNRDRIQYVDEFPLTELIVDVFSGADGEYTLYLDDGLSFDFEKGVFDEIKFEQINQEASLEILSQSSNRQWAKSIKSVVYKIHNVKNAPAEVTVDNYKIKLIEEALVSPKKLQMDLFKYNAEKKICEIKIPFKTGKQVIVLKFEL